jgi:hypothetical protein
MADARSHTKIDEYFHSIQKDLENRFKRSRRHNTDTEAKGVAAERIVGEAVEPYLRPSRPTYRREIIDSFGKSSGEVDVIFCNWAQPSVDTELLLAEGVDYAVGVKSILTKKEIRRLVKNAATVKRLERRLGPGELAYAGHVEGKRFIDRIPYIGFALESELSFATAHDYLRDVADGAEPELQPDALFILGRGALINSKDVLRQGDQLIEGWIALPFPDRVLLEFLNFAIGVVPRIIRNGTALRPYLNDVASVRTLPPQDPGLTVMVGDEEP